MSDLTEPERQIIEIIKSSQTVNIKRFQSSLIGQLQKSRLSLLYSEKDENNWRLDHIQIIKKLLLIID